MNFRRKYKENEVECSGGVYVEFYGKFPSLHITNTNLPLEAEAISLQALQHLRSHMINKGLAKDDPKELSAYHLPVFGLFQEEKGLWLSPSHEIMPMGMEKMRLHFRIRFVWLDCNLEGLKPGALHYLYLQCHDDFVHDRIKMLFNSDLEEKQSYVRGMLVVGLVCPQLNCGERQETGKLRNIFVREDLEDPNSATDSTSNDAVIANNTSVATVMTTVNDSSGFSNGVGHAGTDSRGELLPRTTALAGISAAPPVRTAPARPKQWTPSPTDLEKQRVMNQLGLWKLKKRLPASLRRAYPGLWHTMLLRSSVKDHLDQFLEKHRRTPLTQLMSHYVRGILTLVPRYGFETYKAKFVKDDGTTEKVDVGMKLHTRGLRAIYFGEEYQFKLSHFAKIKYTGEVDADGEIEVIIQRRVGCDVTLKFDKEETVESFVSMIHGWYRLEVNFSDSVCPKISPYTQRLMNALQCFGPMNAAVAKELLEGQMHQESPPFLICQIMDSPERFRILSLTNKEPGHVANIVVKRNCFEVFGPSDAELRDPLLKFDCPNPTDKSAVLPFIRSLKERFSLKSYVKQKQRCLGIMQVFVEEQRWQEVYGHREEEDDTCPPEVFDFGSEHVDIENKLGEGMKTATEKARLTHQPNELEVALKKLKDPSDAKHMQCLLATASKLRKMRRKSFINFLGVMVQTVEPFTSYVVLELAPRGDLEQYLQRLKEPQSLPVTVSLALQIAQAGEFLEQHHKIHGNLRCRNILIMKGNPAKHWVGVKVGDPGMVAVYNRGKLTDPYNMDRLPWIAPERLTDGNLAKETIETEVFSYGTLIWELITQAMKKPHESHDIPRDRVLDFYKQGMKLPHKPEYIIQKADDDDQIKELKSVLWKMIINCRSFNSLCRPKFEELRQELHGLTLEPGPLAVVREHPEQQPEMEMYATADEGNPEEELNKLYVDASCIDFEIEKKFLGQGAYGEVKMARYFRPNRQLGKSKQRQQQGQEGERVAVKFLKKDTSDDFMQEVKLLLRCSHPNIVQLKALVSHPERMIVMEYMEGGCLHDYLRKHRSTQNNELYMRICIEVAEGMHYLASRKVVHRDLAARNILLSGELQAKIADFGLSKAFQGDYYKYESHSGKRLPIYWLAPECLKGPIKFSEKSDVWSYGVLMWEIFSGGDDPKRKLDKLENDQAIFHRLLRKYEEGKRLPKPNRCDLDIYKIMENCWRMDIKVRSSFEEILNSLRTLCKKEEEKV